MKIGKNEYDGLAGEMALERRQSVTETSPISH